MQAYINSWDPFYRASQEIETSSNQTTASSQDSDLSTLPKVGEVEKALKRNQEVKEIKKEVGKWLVGIGSFGVITLAGLLAVGVVAALISNPVGWAIGIGIAASLLAVGIFMIAKYEGNWKDVVMPFLIGAVAGLVVIICVALAMIGIDPSSMSISDSVLSTSANSLLLFHWISTVPDYSDYGKNVSTKELISFHKDDDPKKIQTYFSDYLKEISIPEKYQKVDMKIYSELSKSESQKTVMEIYKKAVNLVRHEKYKGAAHLLYALHQKNPNNSKLNREFGEVLAQAYPKNAFLQLKNIQESPYFTEQGNPHQALNLVKSLMHIKEYEKAGKILSFAYAIAYKENQNFMNKGRLTSEEDLHFEENRIFMKAAKKINIFESIGNL